MQIPEKVMRVERAARGRLEELKGQRGRQCGPGWSERGRDGRGGPVSPPGR